MSTDRSRLPRVAGLLGSAVVAAIAAVELARQVERPNVIASIILVLAILFGLAGVALGLYAVAVDWHTKRMSSTPYSSGKNT